MATGNAAPRDWDQASLGERFEHALDLLGLNKHQMATAFSMSPSFLGSVARDEKKPGFDLLNSLLERYRISCDWLLTGRGSVLAGGAIDDHFARQISLIVTLVQRALIERDRVAIGVLLGLQQGVAPSVLLSDKASKALISALVAQRVDLKLVATVYNATVAIPHASQRLRVAFETVIALAKSQSAENSAALFETLAHGLSFASSRASANACGQDRTVRSSVPTTARDAARARRR